MEIQQLEYFKKAADLEHITQAAHELMIAQPALSKTIRTLEEELGSPLFVREKKRIHLNSSGKILLRCANDMERCLAQIREELDKNQAKEERRITLRLKSMPSLLPGLIRTFCREYPDICVHMLTDDGTSDEYTQRYDFTVFSTMNPSSKDSSTLDFFQEEMVLAVPSGHPLAGSTVSLSEVSGENFISLPAQDSFQREILKCCRSAGFHPRIVLESSDYYTILSMIEAGLGIALVPSVSWGYQDCPGISYVRIGEPFCQNTLSLSWTSKRGMTGSCRHFLEFIKNFARCTEDL